MGIMAQHKSRMYRKIEQDVVNDYTVRPDSKISSYWFDKVAPRWRSRVGLPKLVAEQALIEADSLVRSVNRNVYRGDPEMREKHDAAMEALNELTTTFIRKNWERFENE